MYVRNGNPGCGRVKYISRNMSFGDDDKPQNGSIFLGCKFIKMVVLKRDIYIIINIFYLMYNSPR